MNDTDLQDIADKYYDAVSLRDVIKKRCDSLSEKLVKAEKELVSANVALGLSQIDLNRAACGQKPIDHQEEMFSEDSKDP